MKTYELETYHSYDNMWGMEQLFDVMRYPAGESHVTAKFIPTFNPTMVAPHVRNFEDLANIVAADDILRRNDITATWFVPYFPFVRHDRRRDNKDGLEIEVAFKILAGVRVITLDPHNEAFWPWPFISQASVVREFRDNGLDGVADPVYVIPDQGATKKAYTWLREKDVYVQASKVRDPKTGKLSGFSVEMPEAVYYKLTRPHFIIVDDICDAGGTFLGLAEVLKMYDPYAMTLAVTHGLFTKGTAELLKTFNRIYTVGNYNPDIHTIKYSDIFRTGDRV